MAREIDVDQLWQDVDSLKWKQSDLFSQLGDFKKQVAEDLKKLRGEADGEKQAKEIADLKARVKELEGKLAKMGKK